VLDAAGSRHDMDTLALKYLGRTTTHFEDVAGKGAKQITFDQVGIEEAAAYAAEDADVTLALHRSLWPRLEAEPALRRVFTEIELPLVPVLSRMERTGALLDEEQLWEQSRELGQRLQALEEEAHNLAGQAFNLGSPKQLGEVLFDKLGCRCGRKRRRARRPPPRRCCRSWPGLSAAEAAPRASQPVQAQGHLHGQAAGHDQPGYGARAHLLPPGGDRHRAPVVVGSEPAEHPDPHRRGPAHPPRVHCAAGLPHRGCRLLADRAAHHGAPVR
jgi:hypothetical protein